MQNNVIQFNKEAGKSSLIDERFIRAKDLKKIFVGLSPSTITKWAKLGVLKPYSILGSRFYKESDIEKLLEEAKENGRD